MMQSGISCKHKIKFIYWHFRKGAREHPIAPMSQTLTRAPFRIEGIERIEGIQNTNEVYFFTIF